MTTGWVLDTSLIKLINQEHAHTHTTKTQSNITNTPAFLYFFLFGINLLFKEKYVDVGCGRLRLTLSMKFPENCYSLFGAAAPSSQMFCKNAPATSKFYF